MDDVETVEQPKTSPTTDRQTGYGKTKVKTPEDAEEWLKGIKAKYSQEDEPQEQISKPDRGLSK